MPVTFERRGCVLSLLLFSYSLHNSRTVGRRSQKCNCVSFQKLPDSIFKLNPVRLFRPFLGGGGGDGEVVRGRGAAQHPSDHFLQQAVNFFLSFFFFFFFNLLNRCTSPSSIDSTNRTHVRPSVCTSGYFSQSDTDSAPVPSSEKPDENLHW